MLAAPDSGEFRQLLIADLVLLRGVAEARDVAAALQRFWDAKERSRVSFSGELCRIAGLEAEALRSIEEEADRLIARSDGSAHLALTRHGGIDRAVHAALAEAGAGMVSLALARVGAVPRVPLRVVPGERYIDFSVVGEGGMGVVYLAIDTELNRRVAFKIIRRGRTEETPLQASRPPLNTPASQTFEELHARFLQEAWVTGGLEHPGVVPVYELGQTSGGVPYYTMRFVRGQETLKQAIDRVRTAPPEERLRLLEAFLKVCDTVRYAHSRGVIHRDLKPSNVALGDFGEVVLLDWGLAKLRERPDLESSVWQAKIEQFRAEGEFHTGAGALGTPGYMAPEAALGRVEQVDERTDVYSLGSILYEILTGRLPHAFDSYLHYVRKVTAEAPVEAAAVAPGTPQELSDICARALERDRERRIASVDALVEAIRGWQAQSAVDREVAGFLRDARTALAAAEGLAGDALLRQVDLAQTALLQVKARRPTSRTAAEYARKADALREQGIRQREEAAQREAMRRVRRRAGLAAGAVLLVLAIGAFVVSGILNERRKEALRESERAERAERTERTIRTRAEGLLNYLVGDLRDDLRRVGRLELLKDVTLAVHSYFDAADAATPGSRRQLAVALGNLGDVHFAQGHLGEALEAYERRLALLRELQSPDASDTTPQADLALAHESIGGLFLARSDRKRALVEYGQALAIREQLAASDLGSAPARARIETELRLGDAWRDPGGASTYAEESLRHHRRALALAERQTDRGEAPTWDVLLGACHRALAESFRRDGQLASAMSHCQQAQAIAERLVAAAPTDTERVRDLAMVHLLRGDLSRDSEGREHDALAAYREFLRISDALVTQDPSNAEWQEDRFRAHNRISLALQEQGDLQGALVEARGCLEEATRLTERDPSNLLRRRAWAIARVQVAEVLRDLGENREAIEHYEAGARVYQEIQSHDPTNPFWAEGRGDFLLRIAGLQEKAGIPTALERYREALQEMARAADLDPASRDRQVDLVTALSDVARHLREQGRASEGEDVLRRALADWEGRIGADPALTEGLALITDNLAGHLETVGRPQEALEHRRRSLEARLGAAAGSPGSPQAWANAAEGHWLLAQAIGAAGDRAGALHHLEAHVQVCRKRVDLSGTPQALRNLSVAWWRLGDHHERGEEWDAALAAYREALAIDERLVAEHPGETNARRGLSLDLRDLAQVLRAKGDGVAALELAKRRVGLEAEDVAEHPGSAASTERLAAAHADLGELLRRSGDLPAALEQHEISRTLRLGLVERSPEDPDLRSGLAESLRSLGELRHQQGERDLALAYLREHLQMRQRAAEARPDDADLQENLSGAWSVLAEVLELAGQLDEALAAYRTQLGIDEAWSARQPGRTVWARRVWIGHRDVAEVLEALGRAPEALAHRRKSLDVRRAMAEAAPQSAVHLENLSEGHWQLAEALTGSGDLDGALEETRAHLETAKRVADLRGKPTDLRDLAVAHWRLGDHFERRRDWGPALAAYREALALDERLVAEHPGATNAKRGLYFDHRDLATVLRAMGDLPGAIEHARQRVRVQAELAAAKPGDRPYQDDLSRAHADLADLLLERGDVDGGVNEAAAALGVRRALAAGSEAAATALRDLAVAEWWAGWALRHQGSLEPALTHLRAALEIDERLEATRPGATNAKSGLLFDCRELGFVLARLGDFPASIAAYGRAVALAEARAREPGGDPSQLLALLQDMGGIQMQAGDFKGASATFAARLREAEAARSEHPGAADWSAEVGLSRYLIGTAKHRQGDRPGALADLEAALSLLGRGSDDRSVIGQHARGLRMLQEARAPTTAAQRIDLGWALYNEGDVVAALRLYREALEDASIRSDRALGALYNGACLAGLVAARAPPGEFGALRDLAIAWMREDHRQRAAAAHDAPTAERAAAWRAYAEHLVHAHVNDFDMAAFRGQAEFESLFREARAALR